MNEKLTRIKSNLKKHSTAVIAVASTVVVTAVVISINQKRIASLQTEAEEAKFELRRGMAFLGNGTDFITFDDELANKIDNGSVYEYTLLNGVRIAIMKAIKD